MPDIALLTDEDGNFSLGVPMPGEYRLEARSDEGGTGEAVITVPGIGQNFVTVTLHSDTPLPATHHL